MQIDYDNVRITPSGIIIEEDASKKNKIDDTIVSFFDNVSQSIDNDKEKTSYKL